MLTLSTTHLSKIEAHGKDTYPDECCGAILGSIENGIKTVTDVISMDNISDEDKRRRFMIKPLEYQRVEKLAKEKGVSLLGFYHSHPDHPAEPSETDLKFAWPVFSYMITSIQEGRPTDTFSYVLDMDSQSFQEEAIKVVS